MPVLAPLLLVPMATTFMAVTSKIVDSIGEGVLGKSNYWGNDPRGPNGHWNSQGGTDGGMGMNGQNMSPSGTVTTNPASTAVTNELQRQQTLRRNDQLNRPTMLGLGSTDQTTSNSSGSAPVSGNTPPSVTPTNGGLGQ